MIMLARFLFRGLAGICLFEKRHLLSRQCAGSDGLRPALNDERAGFAQPTALVRSPLSPVYE
jgi:hypothetical protein